MLRKNIVIGLIFLLALPAMSEQTFSNYKQYSLTKTSYKLDKIAQGFNYPWALTFLDKKNLLISEKNGGLFKVNIESGKKEKISHSIQHIDHLSSHQGGLLDVYFNNNDNFIYFTYSHKFKKIKNLSSSAVARGKLVGNKIRELKVLLIAKPPLPRKKHYGSRIIIEGDLLFASFGERNEGMIAQDPSQHPGSIVRIKTNGEIPKDNPKFMGKNAWLPEIYTIGVRNPQGMTISPHDGEVYFSNHGPRGGDYIGKAKPLANYGWKDIAWGGTEYSGFSIGDTPFKKEYDMPVKTWVPSMAISSIQFYQGEEFPEWQGDLIVSSLYGQSLIRLDYENNVIVGEEIIFRDRIGRIRDFEIGAKGKIYIVSDSPRSDLWKLSK
ncbi:MAG: PQQ-dependent sugar dehydrogenase [Methylophilaceae bacterium]|nr:PQQ-dependent sugar dehydrogenase [Methylophilaceae bacterium]